MMGVSGIKTRRARPSDSSEVFDLVLAMTTEISGPKVGSMLAPMLEQEVAAAVRGDPDDYMLVAEQHGRLAGCGRARIFPDHPMLRFGPDRRYAYVELMYVVPEARGSGLAGRVLGELEAWARQRGVSNVTLHHSPRARSFYERSGYTPLGEMHKRLEPQPSDER